MIQFTYKGKTYNVVNHATVTDRLKQRELLELPLEGWKVLLEAVNGRADMLSLTEVLAAKVEAYESEVTHKFTYKGEELWWDKITRLSFMNLANCSYDNLLLIINKKHFEINPTVLKNLLIRLEVYSHNCFVQTQQHLQNINKLQTIEDVINYDYTLGYPKKIEIE